MVGTGIRQGSEKGVKTKDPPSRFWMVCAVLVGLFVLLDVAGPYGLWKLHHLRQERHRLYLSNIELSKANVALTQELELLKADSSFQEQVVRHQLGWVRDNELLFKLIKN